MRFFLLLLVYISLFPFSSFSQNVTEEQLGLERSSSLREEIQKLFLGPNGGISMEKLDAYRSTLTALRNEYQKNLISNLEAEGISSETALEKAASDKVIEAYDFIVNRIDLISRGELEPLKAEYELKKILRVNYSLKNIADDALLLVGLKNFYSLLFMGHNIPLDERKGKMPSNIPDIKNMRYFTQADLTEKINSGEDISLIDPPDGPYWKKPKDVSQRNPISSQEEAGKLPHEFEFDEVILSESRPKIKVKEVLVDGKKRKWKMKFGREVNTEYVASRIINLLGFNSDTYYYVKSPRVYFKNKNGYESMINDWISQYEGDETFLPDIYVKETGEDEKGFYVVFHEGLLEERPNEVLRLLGFHFSEMGNWERREVRAQLLVQAFLNQTDNKEFVNNKTKIVKSSKNPDDWEIQELIHDLGLSFGGQFVPNLPNEYPWSFLKKTGKKLTIKFKNNQFIKKDRNPFQNATYSDLKWIARYFAKIQRFQLEQIVNYSGWPEEIGKLFLEKMVKRRNEIVRTFDLDREGFEIWDEVEPNKFYYKNFISKGKLNKDYKSPTPVDFSKYVIFPFLTGNLFATVVPLILDALKSIPFYQMIPLPVDMPGITFERFYPGLGFGVRINRKITKNPDAISQDMNWLTHDTLQLFGTIGAKAYIPIVEPISSRIKGSLLMGKQYSVAYYSSTPFKAALGDFKKVASLPFKKKKLIKSLKPGELYSDGIFIGLEAKEQILLDGKLVAIGAEFGQKIKFLTRTIIFRSSPEKTEVSREKSTDFTLSLSGIVNLLDFLDLEFFSTSIMLGKSKAKTYYFDFKNKEDQDQISAFNYLVYANRESPLLANIPSGTTTSKYYESAFSLGLFADVGGKSSGEWTFKTDPDGNVKKFFRYESQVSTNNIFTGNQRKFKVSGLLEFGDNDFKIPIKRTLSTQYEVKDDVTKFKEMYQRIEKVNSIVGDSKFFTYTPELYSVNHLGPTFMNLNLTLGEKALLCVFEKQGCEEKGANAKKIGKMLNRVEKMENPVKQMVKFGKILKNTMIFEKKFQDLREFIGGEKIAAEFWLKGEFVSSEGYIHLKQAALK